MNISLRSRSTSRPSPGQTSAAPSEIDLDLDGPAAMLREEHRFRAWCARRRVAPSSNLSPEDCDAERPPSGRRSRSTPGFRAASAMEPAWE